MTTNDLATRIRKAIELFDLEQRNTYWKNWHKHPSAKWAISYNNQLYPVRYILGLISREYDYKGIHILTEVLRGSGYTVIQLQQHKYPRQQKYTNKQALPTFGHFAHESDFRDNFIIPLLERMNYTCKREYPCRFPTGKGWYNGRVDVMVFGEGREITLVEAKRRIPLPIPLADDVYQAKSYAMHYGTGTFIIAAPEGIWLFKLNRNKEELIRHFKPNETTILEKELAQLIQEYQ